MRAQTGNSIQNVPEIVSAIIHQIIRPDRRRDGWEKGGRKTLSTAVGTLSLSRGTLSTGAQYRAKDARVINEFSSEMRAENPLHRPYSL